MPIHSKNTKRTNRQGPLKALFKYCFALLFSTSLFGQYSFEFFLSQDRDIDKGKIFFSDGSTHSSHNPSDFPFDGEPDNLEGPDENEPEADADHDGPAWLPASVHDATFILEKSAFLNFSSHIQNRKTVSLVILHHSWKSFLS